MPPVPVTTQRGATNEIGSSNYATGTVAGAGLTWQPRDDFQLDLSFLRGLDDDAPDWQGGFGISIGFR